MSIKDTIVGVFASDEGDHSAPEHKVEDGPEKDWSAAEFGPEYYVDDEWIKENTKEVQ